MIRFKIFGIKISVSFLYICLIAVFLLYDTTKIVIWGIFSSFFHEFFHILSIYFFSAKPDCIIFELSGIKLIKKQNLPLMQDIIVLISGCIGNLILFVICFKLNLKTPAAVNLCLLIFNLLPNINLDGGQILFKILEIFFNFQICLKIYNIISWSVAIFLSLIGVFIIIRFKNPTLFFTGIMLIFSSLYTKF